MERDEMGLIYERLSRYEAYFIEAGIPAQELPRSDDNFLRRGEFTLMHAHFLTLKAKEYICDELTEKAMYLLGIVETILSMQMLLPTERMYRY